MRANIIEHNTNKFATIDKQPFVPICGIQSLDSVHVHAHANDMDFFCLLCFIFETLFPFDSGSKMVSRAVRMPSK